MLAKFADAGLSWQTDPRSFERLGPPLKGFALYGKAAVLLDDAHAARFRQGQRLALEAEPRGQRVRVYRRENELLGTATINEWGVIEPERVVTNI